MEQWSMVERTAKAEIQERKIRVVFLPSDGGSQRTGEATTPGHSNVNGAVRIPKASRSNNTDTSDSMKVKMRRQHMALLQRPSARQHQT